MLTEDPEPSWVLRAWHMRTQKASDVIPVGVPVDPGPGKPSMIVHCERADPPGVVLHYHSSGLTAPIEIYGQRFIHAQRDRIVYVKELNGEDHLMVGRRVVKK